MDVERRYASNGKANTGVALGATGLGVAVLDLADKFLDGHQKQPTGGLEDVLLASALMGCHSHCSDDEYVNRYEAKKDAVIAKQDSENALLKAEINTNNKLSDIFERVSVRIRDLENQVNQNTCNQAVTNQQFSDNIAFVDSKFDSVYKAIADGDEKIKCYVDCHFVPGQLKMPLGSICPPAMPASEPIAKK